MINEEETKKKRLLVFLIIFAFIIILLSWWLYLKIFPEKKVEMDKNFLLELLNKGGGAKESLKNTLEEIKNLKLPVFSSDQESINAETKKQKIGGTVEETLTNEEKNQLKTKILDYINQEKK